MQVGFLPLLALLFIGLKLGSVITWSWWWVLAPMWGPFAIFAVIFLVAALLMGFGAALK
jgi:hypothetical protein